MEPQLIFPSQLLSHDSDILSLFNQCQSIEQSPQHLANNPSINLQHVYPSFDLNIEPGSIDKGYYSDIHIDEKVQKTLQERKPKQIVNKKEKRKNKKRTRMYIQMLENRIDELQLETEKLRKLNKINKEYIQRLNQSEHLINGYFVGRQQVYEKLEHLTQQPQPDEEKIVQEVSSLRLRQGVFGKDRMKAVNYYFKEMVEMLLPQIQKYLIKSADEESDMFDEEYIRTGEFNEEMEGWRRKMLQNFGLQQEVREFFPTVKEKIKDEKKVFDNLLQQFYEIKANLSTQARKIQVIFDGIHSLMTPIEIGKCLCYVDKYRFEKKLSVQELDKHVFEKLRNEDTNYDRNHLFGQAC